MAEALGQVVVATVIDATSARVGDYTYALDATDATPGDTIRGFLYKNKGDKRRLATTLPSVRIDHYDWAPVVTVRRDLGVFVDIGLPDKDIAVSLDDLPDEFTRWPKAGDRLLVALTVDNKERLWAVPADERVVEDLTKRATRALGDMQNHQLTGRVYRVGANGVHVITEQYHRAFIHASEYQTPPRLGEQVNGRVIGIGKNANFNLSLQPLAYERIDDDAAMILANLRRKPDHALPFNDKSDPEAIRAFFGMSKAKFKRALGHLLKARRVKQTATGIVLTEGKA